MAIVWQLSVLHLNKSALISGVLLKDRPFTYNKQISGFKNLLKVVKSYFIGVCDDQEIIIAIGNKNIKTRTNDRGGFSYTLDFIPNNDIKISFPTDANPLNIIQSYPIIFKNTNSSFDVISDIDDTIIFSYTADFFKRIRTVAFTTPDKRKPVEFTQHLLEEFKKEDIRVFYVSKSESNLFSMLSYFIEKNKLPKGSLFLTPYLKLGQLFKSKKHNFKIENIRFIFENSGNKKYVLFGDDSQADMEVYANVVKEFPERILKIYIRQTKPKILSTQKKMWEKLRATKVPVNYFKEENTLNVSNEMSQLKNNSK